ncbi:hypothetical protein [Streptomyces sp. PA5.6]|uniref:hypothetical protein n=1 Tax=Streptomyces sp. PA5.6 TaxID=3035651 RepID=UPI003904A5C8
MENTRLPERAREGGAPLTDAEEEQVQYALRELLLSGQGPNVLRVPHGRLEMVRALFELGWVAGVRTGHTGPALADVPVDRQTVDRAFRQLRLSEQEVRTVSRTLDPHDYGPILWQKVRYHGSLTSRHGTYWVQAIHANAETFGEVPTLRYDLCVMDGEWPVKRVTNARLSSLTQLHEYRA